MRSKQEFKALREQVGMSQTDLALALGVAERSVKRWESIKYSNYSAPQDAWDILDDALNLQRQVISAALGQIDEAAQEVGGYPASVKLVYWSSQAEYDEYHCVDDDGDWRQANATARIVSYALHERGIETDWISGADNLVPKQ
nr:MAG TPA: helix-turn-helix domain protein [Caudoviricetes sp.]